MKRLHAFSILILLMCCAAPALAQTATPTRTPTRTLTPTITPTPTRTLTPTVTPTLTYTPSPIPTWTLTPSQTPTLTLTVTLTPSRTPTITATPTITLTPTWSPTPTWTPKPATSTTVPWPTITLWPAALASGGTPAMMQPAPSFPTAVNDGYVPTGLEAISRTNLHAMLIYMADTGVLSFHYFYVTQIGEHDSFGWLLIVLMLVVMIRKKIKKWTSRGSHEE